ncbi:hypothetical protein OC834_007236 [Tilletia horrida]|nr:hypothetical protein OC834_007236 [Tilletia horrida]KAK0546455.1 hypothetical protein OC844_007256 [Tilletia horrida]
MGGKGKKTTPVDDPGNESALTSLSAASTPSARDDGPESVRALIERVLDGQKDAWRQLEVVKDQMASMTTRLNTMETRSGRVTPTAFTSAGPPMTASVLSDSAATAPAPSQGPAEPTLTTAPEDSTTMHRSKTCPSFTYRDRNALNTILGPYGYTVGDVFPAPTQSNAPTALPGQITSQTPINTTFATSAQSALRSDTSASLATAPRQLICKAETLTSFDGDPTKLEDFVSRVEDIARSSDDPAWDAAVRLAIPQALTGMASKWHSSLTKTEARSMRTVSDVTAAMRRAFPMNRAELRKMARDRHWDASNESAMAYYFDKVQLIRQAFGDTYQEASLAQDVADGLEPSMRAYIRLPSTKPTLQQLQDAIAEWEPTWRVVHGVHMGTPSVPATPSQPEGVTSPTSTPPTRPPRSEHRLLVSRAQSAPKALPAQSSASVATLSQSYDPSRVVPAANGQPRMYRRPDSTRVMRLNRNCHKCGQPHFDFEHDHLLTAGKVHVLESAGHDYDEVDESELNAVSGSSFLTSETTLN